MATSTIQNGRRYIAFNNNGVTPSAWSKITTNPPFPDFPWQAQITTNGVNAGHFAYVIFDPADAVSGNFAPVSQTDANKVYIYAAEKPSDDVTIPSIIIFF